MRTTFELQPKISGINQKLIMENLCILENIWNIAFDSDSTSVSFEYMSWADLESVRRELHELGFHVINETHKFDSPENLFDN
jgi:hypothetical protein